MAKWLKGLLYASACVNWAGSREVEGSEGRDLKRPGEYLYIYTHTYINVYFFKVYLYDLYIRIH